VDSGTCDLLVEGVVSKAAGTSARGSRSHDAVVLGVVRGRLGPLSLFVREFNGGYPAAKSRVVVCAL